ncbi:MAG TPA: glycosyltransferase family 2 protein, partial [Usitatibacter sp.]|nr:glycosyltransferase family 2 protein [Usitatibacter sp.]
MVASSRTLSYAPDAWDRLILVLIVLGLAFLAWLAFATPLMDPLTNAARQGRWGTLLVRPTVIWVAMGTLLLMVRTAMWLRYRPFASANDDDAPSLTVLIPAYNEGRMVEKSIESAVAARYPRARLQVIAIDDGSTDDTWRYIERAASRHGDRVIAMRMPKNGGKRSALAAGVRAARGDIVVTVDSDSVIEPGSLLAMAGPFRDAKVGAVAGKVCVYNRERSLLARMLHVRFILSFDFLRSAQSAFRTVYCCPGALSAYRTAVFREVLARWERQTFLGAPCTYGEDRALTNLFFERGYDAVYQRSAIVHTVVPETYSKLCRMYLRWNRSYVREELRFARIVWNRPALTGLMALLDTTITNVRYPVAYVSIAFWLSQAAHDPATLLRMLVAIGAVSTFYMLYYLRSER